MSDIKPFVDEDVRRAEFAVPRLPGPAGGVGLSQAIFRRKTGIAELSCRPAADDSKTPIFRQPPGGCLRPMLPLVTGENELSEQR